MKKVLKEFGAAYAESLTQEFPDNSTREDRLRVSGFPYCGLRHFYQKLTFSPEAQTFSKQFYTSVGTATHEAIQQWMGSTGSMYGNWTCGKAECSGSREMSRRNDCPKCGSVMDYHEFEVRAFNHLSGHLDGLYQSKDKKFYVIDYKTSSTRVILSNNQYPRLPYRHNMAQIKAYCALIELEMQRKGKGIEVEGWILHYIARDNPLTTYVPTGELITEEEKQELLTTMQTYDGHYEIVMFLESLRDCKTLIDQKPCRTKADYLRDYDNPYQPCPLVDVCFEPVSLRAKLRAAWNNRNPKWQEVNRPAYLHKFTVKKTLTD